MPTLASRSPSPNPSRASNPNPRTPDGIGNRRNSCSQASNPTSDAHQRNSCSRAGSAAAAAGSPRASFELKENAVGRSRSPAMSSSSKGTKHFMSPTISASSKVTAASPRRKVLGEKNEAAVRSSLTSFPVEPPAADEVPLKPDAALSVTHELNTEQMPKHSSDLETKSQCSDVPAEPVAPLDADPRLPPYDPETNYLSPRPRFLHYRPNPRIESSVHSERNIGETYDGRRLDDSFSSEVCEESSILSEEERSSSDPGEEQSPDPEEDREGQSAEPQEHGEEQLPDPQEDCEEQSSDVQSDCEEEISLPAATVVPELEAEPSGGTGASTSLRYRFASVLLVSVMACLLAFFWGTPLMSYSSSVLNVPVLQVVNDIHIREHVVDSAMHVKELTSRLMHLPFGRFCLYAPMATLPEYGPVYAANFTAAASANQEVATDDSNRWMMPSPEQSYWGPVEEERSQTDEIEIEAMDAVTLAGDNKQDPETDDSGDVLQDAGVVEEESTQKSEMEERSQTDEIEIEAMDAVTLAGDNKQDPETDDSGDVLQDAGVVEEESTQKSEMERQLEVDVSGDVLQAGGIMGEESMQEPEMQLQEDMDVSGNVLGERIEAENAEVGVGTGQDLSYDHESKYEAAAGVQEVGTAPSGSESSISGSSDAHEISNGFNPRDLFAYAYDSKTSNKLFFGISSAVLLLSACLIFLSSRKQRQMPVVLEDASETAPPAKLVTKELAPDSINSSCVQTSDSPYHDTPVDMMMVDDSGPSESSTGLQQSRSVGRRRASRVSDGENASYLERRQTRRDSTVSSASISYGSYTTLEKLSAKKGPREEEVMITPVRRSSRIRNHQIASP